MTNQERILSVKSIIDSKKWQILNEDRTDKDCLQEEIDELEIELKGLESKIEDKNKWNNWFNKKSNVKVISKEWNDDDYDNLRESEEATSIALSSLE